MSDAISVKKIQEKEEILPKPAKAGDGKLKGLTIPMVGSQLSGQGYMPGKSGAIRRMGKL